MKNNLLIVFLYLSLCCSVFLTSCNIESSKSKINSLEEYRQLRTEKLNKQRRLFHNNDGCDALYFPIDEKYTVKNFLDKRTSGLIGTDVSTISYCPSSSGFGYFSYNTKVGEVLLKHDFEFVESETRRNITGEMIAEGTDPLQATIDFARENNFEIFFSNRMNDTHDHKHRPEKPSIHWTKFKENHPQYLVGEMGEGFRHGRWSSVDFNHKEVRDLCVSFFKEVCDNYDVDGIELDFMRHFVLFKEVIRGGSANQEQLDMLTDMVSQIRQATEEAGMKKGKPILVLIRVPSSVEYAKKAGVDLQRWIDEGLVDIVVGSGYFRLEFWKNFAELGENKNVKMYAGLSESRAEEEHPLLKRQQNAVFRARAAAAWEAGLDGMYIFNQYNTRVKYLSEIGYPENIKNTNNLYFITYRDYKPTWVSWGDTFMKMPRLSPTPGNHLRFNTEPFNFPIEFGDETVTATTYAVIYTDNVDADDLIVRLNGSEAKFKKTEDGLYVFEIDQASAKPGINELYIESKKPGVDQVLKDAAIFFCRDKNDVEMRKLISMCN